MYFMVHSPLYKIRHNAVVVRIKITATGRWTIISEDRAKGCANLRPDLVLKKNNYILINDITIPSENCLEALRKLDKENSTNIQT